MATRTSRAVFGDITNAGDSVAALAGKKPLKSERKADDVDARDASNPQVRTPSLPHRVRNGDARDASNPQAVTEYVNDMRAAASAFYRLFFAAAARAVSAPPPFGFRRRSRVDGVGGGAATADLRQVSRWDWIREERKRRRRDITLTRHHAHRYVHFREKELETSVSPTYMRQQAHINEKMRAILIDWLVEVHLKFKLVPETLYLTVNLIDRYLLGSPVERSNLQLVGVSALLLASKYEEIYPPEVADCTYITDHAYDAQDVLDMEMTILRELDWNISSPSAHHWLVRLARVARAPKSASDRAEYFAQRMLQEYAMLEYKPSLLAAAAAHLAFVADEGIDDGWPRACERLTGYTDVELYPCCKAISYHINRAAKDDAKRQLVACKKKFSRHDFSTVSFGKCPVLKRPKLIDLPDLAD